MHQPWFDGVEINESNGQATGFINHHVVDFWIPVNGSVPQFASLQRCFKHVDLIASLLDEPMQFIQSKGI